jgi:hypothetical protein
VRAQKGTGSAPDHRGVSEAKGPGHRGAFWPQAGSWRGGIISSTSGVGTFTSAARAPAIGRGRSGSGRERLRARILCPCSVSFHVPCSVIEEWWVSRPGLARCNVGKATLFSGATKPGGAGPGAVSMLSRERINVEEGDEMR